MVFVLTFFYLLSFFWFVRTIKAVLFWLYLWQLKSYHWARFLDHFHTHKGKKIFFNFLFIFKIILFFYSLIIVYYPSLFFIQKNILRWQYYGIWILILFVLYFFESFKFFGELFFKKSKKPVFTPKILFLFGIHFFILVFFIAILFQKTKIFYLYWFSFYLLCFDILAPLIVTAIVFLFHPITILARKKIFKQTREKREKFKDLIVIGITGSYGKTSVKEFLSAILATKFNVLKTKEHQNTALGICQCILKELNPEHQIFICEMAAYDKGGIKLLCDFAKPKIGILTGINEQHLATFGSREKIIEAKFELIENLPTDGIAILNGDNEFIRSKVSSAAAETGQKSKLQVKSQKFYSIKEKLDIWTEEIKIEKENISFKVFLKSGENLDFKINLLGKHNILNMLGVVLTAKELEMSLREISQACQKIIPEQGGMKFLKNKFGLNIIDSSYSANPNGVMADLEYLKIWQGKKIIVMPCLIELGKLSKKIHFQIGEKIGEICDLAIVTAKEKFKEIKKGAMKNGMKKENILYLENPKKILERIKEFNQTEDVVLLEGRVPAELIALI